MNPTIDHNTAEPISFENRTVKPYPPSYMDRLMDGIKRLPIPYGLTYFAIFIVLGSLNHLVSWADGWLAPFAFNPMVFIFPLWFCLPLAIMTYLDGVARKALYEFRPLLDVSNEAVRQLEYEFTNMPPRAVILSSVFWGIMYVVSLWLASDTFFRAFRIGMTAGVILGAEGLVIYATGSVIYYHSIRQLRLVSRTVNLVKHFNLFRLEPVYAFSAVTSRTAVAWALLIGLTLLIFPFQLNPIPVLTLLVVQILFAVAAFVLPLRVVNQRLVAEKRRLESEQDSRVEITLARLNRAVDENQLNDVSQLNSVLGGLNTEREILDKIPTWPWRSRVLTGFLSLTVLPVVLFIIQLAIERLLGP